RGSRFARHSKKILHHARFGHQLWSGKLAAMLFDCGYTTSASTTCTRVEANQTYWRKHNLQIGPTLLSNGLPGCYLRLSCFDVHGHRLICSHERLVHQPSQQPSH